MKPGPRYRPTVHKNLRQNRQSSQKESWRFFSMSEEDVSLIPLKITITKGQNFDASSMGFHKPSTSQNMPI